MELKPRECTDCNVLKTKDLYTPNQWKKFRKGTGKCIECQETEQKEKKEALKIKEEENRENDKAERTMIGKQKGEEARRNEDYDENECCVCFEKVCKSSRSFLPCVHWMCKACMSSYINRGNNKCPECRKIFNAVHVRRKL